MTDESASTSPPPVSNPQGRWLLLHGDSYYGQGGWGDSPSRWSSQEDAAATAVHLLERGVISSSMGWWHIVDLDTNLVVGGRSGCHSGSIDGDAMAPGCRLEEPVR